MFKNNKLILSFTLVFIGIIFTSSILVASASYFNNKEIDSLTNKCHQNNGEPTLEINNKITNSYSFECNESQK